MRRFPNWHRFAAASTVAAFCSLLVFGAGVAGAASPLVDCTADAGALTTAIATAAPATQLLVRGRCVGSFVVEHDLTLRGVDGGTLDGGSTLGPVLGVAAGATVEVDNLTITGGTGQACPDFPFCPFNLPVAGIDNRGTLTLFRDTIAGMVHSLAHISGIGADGAIRNWPGGVLALRNSSVVDNTSEALSVGPATAFGGIANAGTMEIANSEVSRNSASAWTDAVGGIWNTGTLTISNSTVGANTASGSGQVVVGGILNANGTLTIANGAVSGNSASFDPTYPFLQQIAGGIYNAATISLRNGSITGNVPTNCNFVDSACS